MVAIIGVGLPIIIESIMKCMIARREPHIKKIFVLAANSSFLAGPGSALSRASAPGRGGPGFKPGPRHTKVVKMVGIKQI